jgi:hypothetical protein
MGYGRSNRLGYRLHEGQSSVLVGFEAARSPILNNPASPADASVQRTYLRSELEPLWLEASSATVYLIYPQEKTAPELP